MAASDLELRVAWQRHVERGQAADEVFESVVTRHRDAARHYHDARHVQWVVRHVLDLADQVDVGDLGAIVAAAFFHDAIYELDRTDNEIRSAELAVTMLRGLGWDAERCGRVAEMIVATQHRAEAPAPDIDTAVLIAADLAILGAGPAAYSDAARRIRREYAHLDDAAWREGRSAVLAGFLDRSTIYPPELGLMAWERRARANLTAELAALR